MTLAAGTRFGPYEVLSPLGAGGMGEVYRARDSKLKRDVAVKVLPQSVAADPDTLARFEREAKAVAAISILGEPEQGVRPARAAPEDPVLPLAHIWASQPCQGNPAVRTLSLEAT